MENRENVNVESLENEVSENMENVIECEYCGRIVNLDEEEVEKTADYDNVCSNCINNHFSYCEDCEDCVLNDDIVVVDNGYRGAKYICQSCADNDCDIYYCESCEEYYTRDNMVVCDNASVCQSCYDRYNYCVCDDCGDLCSESDWSYNENDDRYYCNDCWGNHISRVADWHDHKGEFNKVRLEGEEYDITYYGVEYEVVHKDSTKAYEDELLDTMENALPCVFERDGSLDYSGVEIITQPMSWNYIQSNREKMESGFGKAIELGYRSDEFSCCGQHIHVSRPSDDVVDRIELILETYKDEFIAFARRHNEHYAKFLSDKFTSTYDKERLSSIEYIKKSKDNYDRYMVLNLTNSDTIEFRLFKGTLRFETCMANLELVHNLMELCGDLDKPIEEITWTELTKGEYIENYVSERGITTDKVPKDRTLEFVEKDNVIKDIINNVRSGAEEKLLGFYNSNIINLSSIKEFNIEDIEENLNMARTITRVLSDIPSEFRRLEQDLNSGKLQTACNRLRDIIRYKLTDFISYSEAEKMIEPLNGIEF